MSLRACLSPLVGALSLLVALPAFAASGPKVLRIPDPAGGEIEIGVWVPDTPPNAGPAPLIVMSHGNGGWYRGATDTAEAFADAGFVVAALTHTGDNFRDQSRATDMPNRPRQLGVLIDYMIRDWHGGEAVDAGRIGAYGFSSGGFTVLAAAGGVPDGLAIQDHCRRLPDSYDCRLSAEHPVDRAAWTGWHKDDRIRAVVAAAPALGYAFTDASLGAITIPVQLWRAEQDQVLRSPDYADAVRDRLPSPPDYHVAPGAGHFDFLPPCDAQLAQTAPAICASAPGFDRAAFHKTFNAEMVRFFSEALQPDLPCD